MDVAARMRGVPRALLGRARKSALRFGGGADQYVIPLDYPVDPRPRFGYDQPPHPRLHTEIENGRDRYADTLESFVVHRDHLLAIARSGVAAGEPWWHNGWFGGLDAVALYSFLAQRDPARLVEIGSGNSTTFARRAIRDHGLRTEITSIDPHPRAEIDALCDRVVRSPLEETDLTVFGQLAPGDVCFIDGSHRVFMNSDATVFFTEVLPSLATGVLVHVHDCFLPWDYPPQTAHWYWSEHYLLACWLLAGDALEVVCPNFYISTQPDLHHILDPIFDQFTWSAAPTNGTGFWFEVS